MKRIIDISLKLLVAAGCWSALSSTHLFADSGSWSTDASANWSVAGDWLGGIVADGPGNTATFNYTLTAARTVTLDSARTIGNLVFGNSSSKNGGNWIIGGTSSLTLDNSGNAPTITCWPLLTVGNSACTLNCPLVGTNGIVKLGTGTLWMDGKNAGLSGPLTLAAGRILTYQGSTNLGIGPVTIASGCYISFYGGGTFYNGFTLNGIGGNIDTQPHTALFAAQNTVLNGVINLSYTSDVGTATGKTLTLAGGIAGGPAGGLVVASANTSSPVILAAASTFSGGATVTNGLLQAQVTGSLGTGNVVVENSAMLELDNAAAMSSSASLFLASATVSVNLNFTGTQTINKLYLNGTYAATGTWGAVGSGAANESAFFTGTGLLNVTATGAAVAADGAWNVNLSGKWSDFMNWLSNSVPNGAGSAAAFDYPITGVRTVTVDSPRTLGALVFGNPTNLNGNNWSVAGSSLTLDNGVLAPTITCWPLLAAGNSACNVYSPLIGINGLIKLGTGTLWLNGTNNNLSGPIILSQGRIITYQGATNLGTGAIVVSNGCYVSFFSSGTFYNDFTLNGIGGNIEGQTRNALFTGAVAVLNGKIVLNSLSDIGTSGSGSVTVNGVVSGPGGLLVASTSASGSVTLTAPNTFSGGTLVNSGSLFAQNSGSLGAGDVVAQNTATIELDNAAAMSSGASLYLVGAAPVVNLNFAGNQTINKLYFNGAYAAAGTWGAVGSGAANESSFFTGSGLLNVTSSGTLGAGSGAWTVDAGGTWDNPLNWRSNTIPAGVGNTAYFTNHLTGARTVTVDTAKTIGKLVFGQAGDYVSNNWNIAGSQILTLDNGGSLPEMACWPLKDYNSACTFSCPISSSLGLLKTGFGSLWLSGNNLGMNGTLIVAQGRVFNSVASGYGIGNMNVVVSNGCYLSFWKGGDLPNSFTLNGMGAAVEGQTQSALMASSGTAASDFTVEGTLTLNATSDIGGSYSNQLITLNGLVTGPGGLVKNGLVAGQPSYLGFTNGVGPGTLVLAHVGNDYAGGTWVNGGLLQAQAAGTLGSGDVTVADGAQLELDDAAAMNSSASLHLQGATSSANLNFSGTQTVHTLYINNNPCAAGTWGASGSGAANENAAFTGSGLLDVSVTGTPVTSGTPTNITVQVSAGTLVLSWPADHLGWYAQSNSVSLANPGAWFDMPGSQTVTNLNLPVNPSLPQVFYRLRHP